jgi:hypothetical protein
MTVSVMVAASRRRPSSIGSRRRTASNGVEQRRTASNGVDVDTGTFAL